MLRAALVISVAAAASPVAAKPCPVSGMKPVVAQRTTLTTDGGFVVMATSVYNDPAPRGGDAAIQPDWRINGAAPTIDTLAPGLAVYRLAASATGTAKLTDAAGKLVADAAITARRAPPPTPEAKRIVRATQGPKFRTSTVVTVEIDGAVPVGTVALVVATPAGKPLTWGRANQIVTVYAVGGCYAISEGSTPPALGDKVVLHWVDDVGRLSAPSAPLVVKAATP